MLRRLGGVVGDGSGEIGSTLGSSSGGGSSGGGNENSSSPSLVFEQSGEFAVWQALRTAASSPPLNWRRLGGGGGSTRGLPQRKQHWGTNKHRNGGGDGDDLLAEIGVEVAEKDLYYGPSSRPALDPGMGGPGWFGFRPQWDASKPFVPPARILGFLPKPWPPLRPPAFAHECFLEWNIHCKVT
jgi:hypothetical protein